MGFTENSDIVNGLEEQFQKVINFQLLTVDSLAGLNVIPAGYLTDFLGKYGDKQFILLDTAMRVRNVYNDDAESIKKLVEHIAIVLPRQKESDIEMKK
mgnify:CR=1 FL=1